MKHVKIELLDKKFRGLFGERDVLLGRYPSSMNSKSAVENLYNRYLPPNYRYRLADAEVISSPMNVRFSYRTMDGHVASDPLCRVTITEQSSAGDGREWE